jgi:hypothetical protein
MSGWLVGPLAAAATLVALAIVWLGLYTSVPGLLIAAGIAFWVGAGVAALVERGRATRNAAIVAAFIVVLLAACLVFLRSQAPPPGASHGGPNVPRPAFE